MISINASPKRACAGRQGGSPQCGSELRTSAAGAKPSAGAAVAGSPAEVASASAAVNPIPIDAEAVEPVYDGSNGPLSGDVAGKLFIEMAHHRDGAKKSKAGEAMPMAMKLYTFWRSIATFRVRIALNLKGLRPDETVDIDLIKGDQRQAEYRAVNPQMVIPALIDGDGPLMFQSMAIMEYLEEVYPQPPLLPTDPFGRARVRGLAMIAVADAHPMSVPRVRNYLANEAKFSPDQVMAWVRHWQSEALAAYETHLARDRATGRFCHGDSPTLADICLAGQAVGSQFFDVNLDAYPTVKRIVDACFENDAFVRAHPLKQPGAPEKVGH